MDNSKIKQLCRKIIEDLLGPEHAKKVDTMYEAGAVEFCRKEILKARGEKGLKSFNKLIEAELRKQKTTEESKTTQSHDDGRLFSETPTEMSHDRPSPGTESESDLESTSQIPPAGEYRGEEADTQSKHALHAEDISIKGISFSDPSLKSSAEPHLQPMAGVRSDSLDHQDRLKFAQDVNALCSVIASRDVKPPLSIGLFGDWGVGKSFFMQEMRKRISRLAHEAKKVEEQRETVDDPKEPEYWSGIAQIEFNAWHYVDDNLWASIVSRIFDGLSEHLAGPEDQIATKRDEILKEIESTNESLMDLQQKQQSAIEERKDAETKLKEKVNELKAAEKNLKALNPRKVLEKVWLEFKNRNGDLTDQLRASGYSGALEAFDDVNQHFNDMNKLVGRLSAQWNWLFSKGNGLLMILVIVVIVFGGPLVGTLFKDFFDKPELSGTGKWVTWLAGFAATIGGWLGVANKWLKKLTDKIQEFKIKEDAQSKALLKKEADERRAIEALKESEAELVKKIHEKQEDIKTLEDQLEDFKVGRRMLRFIQDRASASEYKEQLGIIATIRKDCHTLSELLKTNSEEKRKLWNNEEESEEGNSKNGDVNDLNAEDNEPNDGTSVDGGHGEGKPEAISDDPDAAGDPHPISIPALANIDRIVLYIDDLDRCPPGRVVEVLQAVHLLLAFELFVVVVAVDSRWLLLSLEKHYPDFLKLDQDVNRNGDTPLTRWASTPQHYLEKIFQISLNIRRMDRIGFKRLVKDLVPVDRTDGGSSDHNEGEEGETGTDLNNTMPLDELETLDLLNGVDLDDSINLNPPHLRIQPYEIEFMANVHKLIDTPRAVNRFINTYRLIRATLEAQEELGAFEDEAFGGYSVVQVLLAILVGKPYLANHFFAGLNRMKDDPHWQQIIEKYIPTKIPEKDYRNNIACPKIAPADVQRWEHLVSILQEIRDLDSLRLITFRKWAGVVVRFAIHPIRM